MSNGLNDFGFVEELFLLGASNKTIQNMTGLTAKQVEHIIYQIEKNRKILANQNKEDK